MILTYEEERAVPLPTGERKTFTVKKGVNLDNYLDHAYGEQLIPSGVEGEPDKLFRSLTIRLKEKERQLIEEERVIEKGVRKGQIESVPVVREALISHPITDDKAIDKFFAWVEKNAV